MNGLLESVGSWATGVLCPVGFVRLNVHHRGHSRNKHHSRNEHDLRDGGNKCINSYTRVQEKQRLMCFPWSTLRLVSTTLRLSSLAAVEEHATPNLSLGCHFQTCGTRCVKNGAQNDSEQYMANILTQHTSVWIPLVLSLGVNVYHELIPACRHTNFNIGQNFVKS